MRQNFFVRRGMVFWYNIDPSVDKHNVPKIQKYGESYTDRILYGHRPWLVVSSDDVNVKKMPSL